MNTIIVELTNIEDLAGCLVLIDSIKKHIVIDKSIIQTNIKNNIVIDTLKNFYDEIINIVYTDEVIKPNYLMIDKNKYYIFKNKPYIYEGDLTIEEKKTKKMFILWFMYYREIINNNFLLLDNVYLKETNEILKLMTKELNKQINTVNELENTYIKNILNKLYKTNIKDNIYYYYFDTTKEYQSSNIKYDILNIKYKNFKYSNIEEINIREYIVRNMESVIILLIDESYDENDSNVIYKKTLNLNNYELKNILFNVNKNYVYNERIKYLNNNYKNNSYVLTVICYKTINNIFQNKYYKQMIVCNDNKIEVSGLLLNNENYNADYIKLSKNIYSNLLIQSLKIWIYNNYIGNQIDNVLIIFKNNTKLKVEKYDNYLLETININNIIIIDKNNYTNAEERYIELNKLKLFFMTIIIYYYDNFIKKYNEYDIDIMNNDNFYYLDGLKINKCYK